ncbi:MAG: ThiF family adenylyltransferase [Chitinophagales bacterium]|jgi:tRNA A37 threonylcarbamoyladenosine dehydratase|nr:tRNA threonylcarbamoyladenosine dehydratase [Sphingobacteriales bacterium]
MEFLSRSELLLGRSGLEKLKQAHILVVGLGGVGSYAAEALIRAGVGEITIVDGDYVVQSNINRQLQALHSTIGQSKSDLMSKRLKDVNPELVIHEVSQFLNPEDINELLNKNYSYVLDCIDSVTPKLQIIMLCKQRKLKFISSMGAGGKTDPARIKIVDINETRDCFFSREIRKRLRREHYNYGIKVVYSDEVVDKDKMELTDGTHFKKSYYGTISYMPAMFGLTMASYVIQKILASQTVKGLS